MENYFIDQINSLLGTSSISPFTTKINIVAAVVCLIDIPYEIISLINRKETTYRGLLVSKYIVSASLMLTFFTVLFVIFPITCVYTESFVEGFKINYLNGNQFTHVIIPLLFVLSFIFLDEKCEFNIKMAIFSAIPASFYIIIYILLVYVLKTWDDIYFSKEAIKYITVFGVLLLVFTLIGISFLFGLFLKRIKRKSQNQ